MAAADLLRRYEADALVREAHLNVHRYPESFPGLRVRLRASDERGMAVGRATLAPGAPARVELHAGADMTWIGGELEAMTLPRWNRAYEDADGRFDKDIDGVDGPLGRVVHLCDPALTTYWIENGHVSRASRTAEAGRTSTQVQEHAIAPDGGTVATHFVVVLQDDASGATIATHVYRDAWVERWGVLVPARRRVVSLTTRGSAARDLVIEHHELLGRRGVADQAPLLRLATDPGA